MTGIRISAAIRLHYLQRLFEQDVNVLDSMTPGYAINTITSTSNTLQLGISEKLGVFVEYYSTIVTALIIAFVYNWILTFVVFSVVVFVMLLVTFLTPLLIKVGGRMAQADGEASSVAGEALSGIRMIVACGAEGKVAEKYNKFVRQGKAAARQIIPIVAIQIGSTVLFNPPHALLSVLTGIVLCCIWVLWTRILVWNKIICRRSSQQCWNRYYCFTLHDYDRFFAAASFYPDVDNQQGSSGCRPILFCD